MVLILAPAYPSDKNGFAKQRFYGRIAVTENGEAVKSLVKEGESDAMAPSRSGNADLPADLVRPVGLDARLGADRLRARRLGLQSDPLGHAAHADLLLFDAAVHHLCASGGRAGRPLGP